MLVKCLNNPNVYIYDLKVKFVQGEAEVTDKKKLDALKKMEAKGYEFEFVEDEKASVGGDK